MSNVHESGRDKESGAALRSEWVLFLVDLVEWHGVASGQVAVLGPPVRDRTQRPTQSNPPGDRLSEVTGQK